MSAGSFSAALSALKAGEFVRQLNWGDEFLVLMGPQKVTPEQVGDARLREMLSQQCAEGLHDHGNIRKVNLEDQTVINGWTPSPADLMADTWVTYAETDMAMQRLERTLTSALNGHGIITRDSLSQIVGEQLDALEIAFSACYAPGMDALAFTLQTNPYRGLRVLTSDGRYFISAGPAESDRLRGSGRLFVDLQQAVTQLLGQKLVSDRKFHRTMITLEILSENPIPQEMDVDVIVRKMEEDDYVGRWNTANEAEVDGKQMADLLHEFGSEPRFFALNDAGKDA